MTLTQPQRGVLRGVASGAVLAIVIALVGIMLNPFSFSADTPLGDRVSVALQSATLLAISLAIAIGRLAKHRFLTPEDIDGGGLHPGSDRAVLLQSLLQNTLEQAVLGGFAYVAWAITMPPAWLSVIPLAAITFALGRVLFFAGYARGAPARALGFAMTFYPSVVMLLFVAFVQLARMASSIMSA